MKVQDSPPLHLTYCLNVHPGETWEENFAAIREKAMKVRDLVAPRALPPPGFGLGLRLGNDAARTLAQADRLKEFKDFLAANGLYVFTINGFPYGRFHGRPVKEQVYAPDWRTVERRDYTMVLADILAALLPEGVSGSISTVPGSYKAWIKSPDDVAAMARALTKVAAHLRDIHQRTGRCVRLALEPEPDCFIETTQEAVGFFQTILGRQSPAYLESATGLPASRAREAIREYLGVCFDTAHAAVEFEDLADSVGRLGKAGIRVPKVQLSAALSVGQGPRAISRLSSFLDETYLHQVKAFRPTFGIVDSYADLPEAIPELSVPPAANAEVRVHFHVPLYWEGDAELHSTSSLLPGEFAELLRAGATEHLEIETYTFHVLPEFLRAADVTESIAREYKWVMEHLLSR